MIFPYEQGVANGGKMWYHLGMEKRVKQGEKEAQKSAQKSARREEKRKRREEKRRAREERRRARAESHVVVCPHCGKNVLDHMTKCPYCEGALVPRGYTPVDPEKYKKIKIACTVVGVAVGIAVLVVIFVVLR